MSSSKPLWQPTAEVINNSEMMRFHRFVEKRHGITLADNSLANYNALHDFSVRDYKNFWRDLWDFTDTIGTPGDVVVDDNPVFEKTRWFPHASLNYAENMLRFRDDRIALIGLDEIGRRREMTYRELYQEVARIAGALRRDGVGSGDRVAAIVPNCIEAVVLMLATASLGAIYSSCSPDFGFNGIIDRIGQIKPAAVFACNGYYYNGKTLDFRPRFQEILDALQGTKISVLIDFADNLPAESKPSTHAHWDTWKSNQTEIDFVRVPFAHPLVILYSSGTTGLPKCIVHGVGGSLLQLAKEHRLHCDIKRDDIVFYYSTCGWMMWNWIASTVATGCTAIVYDGSPFAKDGNILFDAIDDERITVFGVSAKFLSSVEKSGHLPRKTHSLKTMRMLLSTGSPLMPEQFDFVYRDIKPDVCLSSISGGTDIMGCFVMGNPILPVYRGEIQCKALGMAVEFRDEDGKVLPIGKGELCCTVPFPSTPIGFWNDTSGEKFHNAYFSRFDNCWGHGDYGEFTVNGGVLIHGRSDAVLNPGGVRIGTAEIYRQVEKISDVIESIAIAQQWKGDVRIVLFVVLRGDLVLDDAMRDKIRDVIRRNASPRHVPAKILQVAEIPRTTSGKITEIAVRDVVHGLEVKNQGALANAHALAHFRDRVELTQD